ncbi:hypothetical protein Salat_1787700 [Sesamum alatum]|uniref:Uncharacterized protein n=1 Tax=Sesamum alatum TaxID=300844 RepID=A0AAE1Y9Q1_9LAMI|nr:hypothetical protein Salat_1787700 [Sesamum alatum]
MNFLLCGVDIGMIVYGPAQNHKSNEPTVWPRDGHELLASLIDSYESRSGHDCRSRTYKLSAFFKDQTEKTEEELKKLRKKMREVKYPKWDGRYNCLSGDQLKEIVSLLMTKIDAYVDRCHATAAAFGIFDAQAIIADQRRTMMMNNGASCNQNTLSFGQNPENAVFMPTMCTNIIQQQQQPLAYYDTRAITADQRRAMMMNNGASCSQNTFSFDESPDNYAYSCDENSAQNCGLGTGIMENVGANIGGALMSYYVPNMAAMPQNRQHLSLSGAFPQMQAPQGGDYVQRHCF